MLYDGQAMGPIFVVPVELRMQKFERKSQHRARHNLRLDGEIWVTWKMQKVQSSGRPGQSGRRTPVQLCGGRGTRVQHRHQVPWLCGDNSKGKLRLSGCDTDTVEYW